MFLVDTNIFLEVMLGKEKSSDVKDFLTGLIFLPCSSVISPSSQLESSISKKKSSPIHQSGQRRYWQKRARDSIPRSIRLSKYRYILK